MEKIAKIKLPCLVNVSDYHQFSNVKWLISILSDTNVEIEELGFDTNSKRYIGVIYSDELPSKKIINKLIKENKIVLNTYN